MTATAIVGAQFGSEGKGVVAAALAGLFDAAVRVGGPNAGHSFRVQDSDQVRTYKMRGIPCAWINPECELYIGAGAVVDPELLARELNDLPPRVKVYVDRMATVVTHDDAKAEAEMGLGGIGSTLEGVGMARIKRIRRDGSKMVLAKDYDLWHDRVILMNRTADWITTHAKSGDVMLEGAQGGGLSLIHGNWPHTTSGSPDAAGLASDAGLAPSLVGHVFLVARTLPIRVAGPSGELKNELNWDQIPGVTPERTTVTNKVRRIGKWDSDLFVQSANRNQPCGVFLMFADYLVPDLPGARDAALLLRDSPKTTPYGYSLRDLTHEIENIHNVPILAYGTGGAMWELAWRNDRCIHGDLWNPAHV